MKRFLFLTVICLLAACSESEQSPSDAPLEASRNEQATFEAVEGTTVRLEDYL